MASSIVEQNQSLKMSSLAGARAGPGSGGPLRGRGLARSRGAEEWGGCGRCCEEGDVHVLETGTKQKEIRKEVCWTAERAGGVSWGLRRTKGVCWEGEGGEGRWRKEMEQRGVLGRGERTECVVGGSESGVCWEGRKKGICIGEVYGARGCW
jgi:hypothetical protein